MSLDDLIKAIVGTFVSIAVPLIIKSLSDCWKRFETDGKASPPANPECSASAVLAVPSTTFGISKLLLYLEIIAILIAAVLAWVKVVSILLTLPIVAMIGILLVFTSKKRSYSIGVYVGLSSIALLITCIFFLFFPWKAGQAKLPIQIILTLYASFISISTISTLSKGGK